MLFRHIILTVNKVLLSEDSNCSPYPQKLSHSNNVFLFRASELKFQNFILMSLELVYGYKASNLFLREPHAFEMLYNPSKLA